MCTKKCFLFYIALIFAVPAMCRQMLQGSVADSSTNLPLEGATVTLLPAKIVTATNANGKFVFKRDVSSETSVLVSEIGYADRTFTINEVMNAGALKIPQRRIVLEEVTVVSNAGDQYKPISRTDIAMRGVNNSQEVLRIIPGIVIGQHQGGGKAEQIFLRGFDADHGTDFREDVDGLPVNMVSHAHGQGFADSHFIIPETI
jgi:outer membrane receptor for Fe3+-dicitrate